MDRTLNVASIMRASLRFISSTKSFCELSRTKLTRIYLVFCSPVKLPIISFISYENISPADIFSLAAGVLLTFSVCVVAETEDSNSLILCLIRGIIMYSVNKNDSSGKHINKVRTGNHAVDVNLLPSLLELPGSFCEESVNVSIFSSFIALIH